MDRKRLVRSRSDRMVGGVCGGLGAYLGVDPTFVRLFFVFLIFAEGAGFLLYLILWVVLPPEDRVGEYNFEDTVRDGAQEIATRAREIGKDLPEAMRFSGSQAGLFLGAAFILLGVFYLLDNLHLTWFVWVKSLFWPVFLIAAGALLLMQRVRGE
jgi:phage shock protein C